MQQCNLVPFAGIAPVIRNRLDSPPAEVGLEPAGRTRSPPPFRAFHPPKKHT